MRVYVYPADEHGCGSHRLIWASGYLREQGYDVEVVLPSSRALHLTLNGDRVHEIRMPNDCDVAVFQRVTNRWMAQAIPLIRQKGIAVVVDVDDDLTAISPSNPAFQALHPRNEGRVGANGQISHHSWHHLTTACKDATLVTVSAASLLSKYAAHGRGRVIRNHLAEHYYGFSHDLDQATIGWPAALMSHPHDPDVVGNALARLVNTGAAEFMVTGNPTGVGRAFGIGPDPTGHFEEIPPVKWPSLVAEIGVGIAPLADTSFNRSKSWLKPLEMSAVGVPWIASPRAEYQQLHDLGAGILADNPKQWYRAMKGLVESRDLREELAGRGRVVAELLRMKDNSWKWWECWEEAYAIQRGLVTI